MITEPENSEDKPFTPETLRSYARMVEDLRHGFMFDTDDAGASPLAEQHYLVAMSYLELAQRAFSIAEIHQMQEMKRL